MIDQNDGVPPLSDADEVAETIVPPEQPPMDDAAGGPQPGAEGEERDDDRDLADVTASGGE